METISKKEEVMEALKAVMDPEIPIISVVDLGIIRYINLDSAPDATITMTPTFTGCPAISLMKEQIKEAVDRLGYNTTVEMDFSEPWNSNMISDEGQKQLEEFGLGAPGKHQGEFDVEAVGQVACPNCKSSNTTLRSPFGSALCRSIHYCNDCKQSFERFKPVW